MIAAHFENLLFLLLIAVALLFQYLSKAATKGSKDQTGPTSTPTPRSPRPIPRASSESDQERIRRFLEALGQPPTSRSPPPVAPRMDIPPRPLAPVKPPIPPLWDLTRAERPKRDVIRTQTPAAESAERAEKKFPPAITTPPAFEVHEEPLRVEQQPAIRMPVEAYAAAARPLAQKADFRTDIATLFASKSGLQDAIILREIFGPPRALRDSDVVL